MKRLFCVVLVLLALAALPGIGVAQEHEPFLFRGRYPWGMPLDEIKKQAEEEGLILKHSLYAGAVYQDVPIAGITAQRLSFFCSGEEALESTSYLLTDDLKEAAVLYPLLLEQLTLVYGEPSWDGEDEYAVWWPLYDTNVTLKVRTGGCLLNYRYMEPEPAPPLVTTQGL